MADFDDLTKAEATFLKALNESRVPYLMVGASAALLQGATPATVDIDLWFKDPGDHRIAKAARQAGGFYLPVSIAEMRPPMVGGGGLGDRFDVVTHMHGLGAFDEEAESQVMAEIGDLQIPLLRLDRIITSKRAANRAKDLAQLPALEAALLVGEE